MGGCGSASKLDPLDSEISEDNIPPEPQKQQGLYLDRAYLSAKKAIANGKGKHLIPFVERYEAEYDRGMLPQIFIGHQQRFIHEPRAKKVDRSTQEWCKKIKQESRSNNTPTISSAL